MFKTDVMSESGKVYYTIGEVSDLLKENASLVRFWAEKFPQFIKPARNKKGNRLFTAKDVENFKLIHHFVKDLGMTLEGAERRMKDNATGEDKRLEVITRLSSIKEKLQSVASQLVEGGDVTDDDSMNCSGTENGTENDSDNGTDSGVENDSDSGVENNVTTDICTDGEVHQDIDAGNSDGAGISGNNYDDSVDFPEDK